MHAEPYFVRKASAQEGENHLKPSHKLAAVWRARLFLAVCLLLLPLRLLLNFRPDAGALCATVLAGVCLMLWALIPRYCGRLNYRLRATEIVIQSGVFFPRRVSLPRPYALYACLYRTPLYLLTGLYGVAVWGAGAHALLPGLTQAQAQAVLSRLRDPEKGGTPQ